MNENKDVLNETQFPKFETNKEGGTSQAKLYLSQGDAQERMETECTEEAEPVLAWLLDLAGKAARLVSW